MFSCLEFLMIRRPFNFKQWIDEHRHLLKPPVGNQCVYDDDDFIVMVVGGPNSRKDYHWDEGEELFYQLEGDIKVQVQEDGKAVDVPIREGEMFLLPPRIPHNPIRGANTVGLVIERKRHDGRTRRPALVLRELQQQALRRVLSARPTLRRSFRAFSRNSTARKTCGPARNAARDGAAAVAS